jgi:hypothetical protein
MDDDLPLSLGGGKRGKDARDNRVIGGPIDNILKLGAPLLQRAKQEKDAFIAALVRNGLLPLIEFSSLALVNAGDVKGDDQKKPKKLERQELENFQKLLGFFSELAGDNTSFAKELKSLADELKEEKKAGTFGPASQKALKQLIDWVKAGTKGEVAGELEEGKLPTDAQLKKLEKEVEQLKRNTFVQELLINLAPGYTQAKVKAGEKVDPLKLPPEVTKRQEELRKELEAGTFGPATKAAFKDYLEWAEKLAVPEAVRTMARMVLSIPPGCPIKVPVDELMRTIRPDLYKALANSNSLTLKLDIDPNQLPSEGSLKKMDMVTDFLNNCNESVATARQKSREKLVNDLIDDLGLPKPWKRKPGDNLADWLDSAEDTVDVAVRSRNYVEAMISLYKKDSSGKFPLELPPNSSIVVQLENGDQRTITADEIKDSDVRALLKTATLKHINMDLPTDLRQKAPGNADRLEANKKWLDQIGPPVDQAVAALVAVDKNPHAALMFGDIEVRNARGRFDKEGHFLGVVGPDYIAKQGDDLRPMNLIGCDWSYEKITEGENAGKWKITQTVRAENAPFWAYQNARFLGVQRVGEPMVLEEKIVEEGAFVPVRNGDKIEIIQATEGQLRTFLRTQQFEYYGEKGLVATLDAAMIVTGTIEIGAACKGARLAAVGAEQALKLTGEQAAWAMTKGAIRVGVGITGVFNNAGARDTDWGRLVNIGRGLYFLGDITLGGGRWIYNAFRGGAEAGQALTAAQKIHTIIHGREAAEGIEAIKGIRWVKEVHTGGEIAFRVCEVGFAPIVIRDWCRLSDRIANLGKRDPAVDALLQIGDGRGLLKAEGKAFDPKNPRVLEAVRALLDDYSTILQDGRAAEVKTQIKDIFDTTKRLLGEDAKESDKQDYRTKLLASITFTPDQIRQLEQAHPKAGEEDDFRLSDEQIKNLLDPSKRKEFPKAVRELADKFLAEKDKDVLAASRIALLFLSRDAKGDMPKEIAKYDFEIPAYTKKVWRPPVGENDTGHYDDVNVPARNTSITISARDMVDALRQDFRSKDLGNRGIVVGDVLIRVEGMTCREYGAVLQDVLRNPNSSKADKMRALTDDTGARMSTIIDGIRQEETSEEKRGRTGNDDRSGVAKSRDRGKNFDLTSEDLMRTLEVVATTDKDPDVRAMAAAQLYGLRDRDMTRRTEILSGVATMWQKFGDKPGEFAKKVTALLKADMNAELPKDVKPDDEKLGLALLLARESKVNAALSLAMITDKDDKKENKDQQAEIAVALAQALPGAPLSLANKIIDALLPDRLKLLPKEGTETADAIRMTALKMVNLPTNRDDEAELVLLLKKMTPLLADGPPELRKKLEQRLVDFLKWEAPLYMKQRLILDPDNAQPYAEKYPKLRAAAIETLVDMGAQSPATMEVIRGHVSRLPIKIGDKEYLKGEPDAAARAAAIKALIAFHDPQLRTVLNLLIDREDDANVNEQLRDVRFQAKRIDPESREWKEIFEETEARLKRFTDTELPSVEAKDVAAFLNDNFDLLDKDKFAAAAGQAAKDALSGWTRFWRTEQHEKWEEGGKVSEITNRRGDQFQALCKMAERDDAAGHKAKAALYFLMTNSGGILGYKGEQIEVHGNKLHMNATNPDWPVMAATALRKLAEPGKPRRDIAAHYIMLGLTLNHTLPAGASMQLLEGLRELAKPDKNGLPISNEERAGIVAKALNVEILRQANQNEQYQLELVKDLGTLQHHCALPVLASLYKSGRFPKVKTECGKVIGDLLFGVKPIWDKTIANPDATKEQRALWLKQALQDKKDYKDIVQQLFAAVKGGELKEAKDNPMMPVLTQGLEHKDKKVSLACAKILAESKLKDDEPSKVKAKAMIAAADKDSLAELKTFWDNAPSDSTITNQERAFSLKRAFTEDKDYEQIVKEMFKAYKGVVIKEGDPGLPFLHQALGDNHLRVRLAAATIIAQSQLSDTDPARIKANKVLIDLLSNGPGEIKRDKGDVTVLDVVNEIGRNRYKEEAAVALTNSYQIDKPIEDHLKRINALPVKAQREYCEALSAIAKHHPDEATRKKSAEIVTKFFEDQAKQVLSGKVRLDPKELTPSDPVLPILLKAFQDDKTPADQRVNAARVWFTVPQSTLSAEDFKKELKRLETLATGADAPAVRKDAAAVIVDSLRSMYKLPLPENNAGLWLAAHGKNEALLASLSKLRTPEARDLLAEVAKSNAYLGFRNKAAEALTNITIDDINAGLSKPLKPGVLPTFTPLTEANDCREATLLSNVLSDKTDEKTAVASIIALFSPTSTGANKSYWSFSASRIADLMERGSDTTKAQLKQFIGCLDKDRASAVMEALEYKLYRFLPTGEAQMTAQTKTAMSKYLTTVCDLYKSRDASPDMHKRLFEVLERTGKYLPNDDPGLKALSDLASGKDKPIPPIVSDSDRRLYYLNSNQAEARLAISLAVLNQKPPCSNEVKERAVRQLVEFTIGEDASLSTRALAQIDKLTGKDAALAVRCFEVAGWTSKTDDASKAKSEACWKNILKIYDRTEVSKDSEQYLTAQLKLLKIQGKGDTKEAIAIDDRLSDLYRAKNKDPEAFYYGDGAIERNLTLLDAYTKKYGENSLEVARQKLLLAKVFMAEARSSNNPTAVGNCTRASEYHAKNAIAALEKLVTDKKLPKDSPELADAYYRLGLVRLWRNDPAAAEEPLRKAWDIIKNKSDQTVLDKTWVGTRLAMSLLDQGKKEESGKMLKELVEATKSAPKLDYPDAYAVSKCFTQVVKALHYPGSGKGPPRYAEAEPLLRRAVEITTNSLGEKDLIVLKLSGLLAENLTYQNKEKEALPIFEKVIKGYRSTLDFNKTDYANILTAYGSCLLGLNKTDLADKAFGEANRWTEIERLEKHRLPQDTFRTITGDGGSRRLSPNEVERLKDSVFDEIERLNERTKKEGETVEIAKARIVLSRRFLTLGLNADDENISGKGARGSLFHAEEALRVLQKKLADNHPDLIPAYYQLAMTQMWNGKNFEAQRNLAKALELCAANPDKVDDNAVLVASKLVLANIRADRPELLKDSIDQVLKLAKQKPTGKAWADVSQSLLQVARIASTSRTEGSDKQAQELYKLALDYATAQSGPDSAAVARVHVASAQYSIKCMKPAVAEEQYNKAIAIFDKLKTCDKREFAEVLKSYSELMDSMGKKDKDKEARDKAHELIMSAIRQEQLPSVQDNYRTQIGDDPRRLLPGEFEKLRQAVDKDSEAQIQMVLAKKGDTAEAAKQAIALARKYLTIALNTDDADEAYGNARAAEIQFGGSIETLEKILGKKHVDLIEPYYQLALAEMMLGKHAKAKEHLNKALEICKANSDKVGDEAVLMASKLVLADAYGQDPSQVKTSLEELLKLAKQKPAGKASTDVSRALLQVVKAATILSKNGGGNFDKEIQELHKLALDYASAQSGEKSAAVALVHVSLAQYYSGKYKPELAQEPLEKAIAIFDKLPTPDKTEYAAMLRLYADILRSQGKLENLDKVAEIEKKATKLLREVASAK